jgi:hypothetical protein
MKKVISLILVSLLLISCQTKTDDLLITGRVKNIKKGKLFLQRIVDSTLVNVDSVSFYNNDDFSFAVELEKPEIMYLELQKDTLEEPGQNFISFFADKGNLTVNSRLDKFVYATIDADYENQQVFTTYANNLKRFGDFKLDLIKEELEARKNGDDRKLDSINKAYDRMNKRRILYAINYAKANPSLEVSPYIVLNQAQYINKNYLDTVYLALDKKIQKSFYGQQLKAMIDKKD